MKTVAVLVLSAFGATALLLAGHIGQQNRCDWLVRHHKPAAVTYSCTGTGTR